MGLSPVPVEYNLIGVLRRQYEGIRLDEEDLIDAALGILHRETAGHCRRIDL